MINVLFIRHGKTEGNKSQRYVGVTDEPLCGEGRDELRSNWAVYEKDKPEFVFASPLSRCQETAKILYPGMPLHTVHDLRECNFGEFENKNYLELTGNPDYQAFIDSNGKLPFPGGEGLEEFQERCVKGFGQAMEISEKKGAGTVALVVHGGTIMAILGALAQPKQEFYHWQAKNGCGYYTEVEKTGDDYIIRVRHRICP